MILLAQSFCQVDISIPYLIENCEGSKFKVLASSMDFENDNKETRQYCTIWIPPIAN